MSSLMSRRLLFSVLLAFVALPFGMLLGSVEYVSADDPITCNGVDAGQVDVVCSGNGTCVGTDDCLCDEGYTGANCQNSTFKCENRDPDDPLACNQHGACVGPDDCECWFPYTGQFCTDEIHCYGIHYDDLSVCSGKGDCTALDTCECDPDWAGSQCSNPASEWDGDGDGYTADVDCDDDNAGIHPGAPDETCDGVDNDCDEDVDEDYVPTPTSCGQGVCSATGALACVNGVIENTCSPGIPGQEVCDSQDNDCDGDTDEGGQCGIQIGIPLELQFGLSGAALMVITLMVFSYRRRRVATL